MDRIPPLGSTPPSPSNNSENGVSAKSVTDSTNIPRESPTRDSDRSLAERTTEPLSSSNADHPLTLEEAMDAIQQTGANPYLVGMYMGCSPSELRAIKENPVRNGTKPVLKAIQNSELLTCKPFYSALALLGYEQFAKTQAASHGVPALSSKPDLNPDGGWEQVISLPIAMELIPTTYNPFWLCAISDCDPETEALLFKTSNPKEQLLWILEDLFKKEPLTDDFREQLRRLIETSHENGVYTMRLDTFKKDVICAYVDSPQRPINLMIQSLERAQKREPGDIARIINGTQSEAKKTLALLEKHQQSVTQLEQLAATLWDENEIGKWPNKMVNRCKWDDHYPRDIKEMLECDDKTLALIQPAIKAVRASFQDLANYLKTTHYDNSLLYATISGAGTNRAVGALTDRLEGRKPLSIDQAIELLPDRYKHLAKTVPETPEASLKHYSAWLKNAPVGTSEIMSMMVAYDVACDPDTLKAAFNCTDEQAKALSESHGEKHDAERTLSSKLHELTNKGSLNSSSNSQLLIDKLLQGVDSSSEDFQAHLHCSDETFSELVPLIDAVTKHYQTTNKVLCEIKPAGFTFEDALNSLHHLHARKTARIQGKQNTHLEVSQEAAIPLSSLKDLLKKYGWSEKQAAVILKSTHPNMSRDELSKSLLNDDSIYSLFHQLHTASVESTLKAIMSELRIKSAHIPVQDHPRGFRFLFTYLSNRGELTESLLRRLSPKMDSVLTKPRED